MGNMTVSSQKAASAETVVTASADPCQTKPPTPPSSSTPRQLISEPPPDQSGGAAHEKTVETSANQITDQSRQSSTHDSHPASIDDICNSEDKPILVLQQATPTSEDGSSLQYLDAVNDTALETPVQPSDEFLDQGVPYSRSNSSHSSSIPFLPTPTPLDISDPLSHPRAVITHDNIISILETRSQQDSFFTGETASDRFYSYSQPENEPKHMTTMVQRRIWVKRAGASATMITVREDDLVDDVRDKILMKYGNSLGRKFDSPDITLRIVGRQEGQRPQDRMLSPEEDVCKIISSYYPGGQKVEEALLIEPPVKKTPRPSPLVYNQPANYQELDQYRPQETGTDYFPQMPAIIQTAASQPSSDVLRPNAPQGLHLPEHARSISVLQTGQVPPLPSPGTAARRHRPKAYRQHTSSPTIMAHAPAAGSVAVNHQGLNTATHHIPHRAPGRHRSDSTASERPNGIPQPPPMPTPPAPEAPPTAATPPTPGMRDHLAPRTQRMKKGGRKITPTNGTPTINAGKNNAWASLLDGSVPPINVLIVEDNMINLKLLEAFMKRLKVRWSTAMNGQIAVNKWKTGGFHLVLMDIQLPIMSGLDATKEIRRLERVNGIGVFSSSAASTPVQQKTEMESMDMKIKGNGESNGSTEQKSGDKSQDKLNMEDGLFKSPVIIVALTASSLQSDRHEALTAGCNDFLTKPVSFVWLERKVKEWGCMQALIDFDGWRKWKDFSSTDTAEKAKAAAVKSPVLGGVSNADLAARAKDKKAKRDRTSLEASAAATKKEEPSLETIESADA
ncbi:hypothetical protein MBLNU457_1402t2 [Dothideomycetes sp. NU457]